jgi:hypothetical protein
MLTPPSVALTALVVLVATLMALTPAAIRAATGHPAGSRAAGSAMTARDQQALDPRVSVPTR